MKRRSLVLVLAIAAMSLGWICRPAAEESKRVIGQTAEVSIVEAALELTARVDTGAATTSVHAESVRVEDDTVSFELVAPDGRRIAMRQPLARTGTVRNAERHEERVYVEMTLQHDGVAKKVLVNLNDRSRLTYPLLIGRNWLQDDYLVDVSMAPVTPATKPDGSPRKLPSLAASE